MDTSEEGISNSIKKDVDIYATNEAIRDISIYATDEAEQEIDKTLKSVKKGDSQAQNLPKIGKDGIGEKLDISGKL